MLAGKKENRLADFDSLSDGNRYVLAARHRNAGAMLSSGVDERHALFFERRPHLLDRVDENITFAFFNSNDDLAADAGQLGQFLLAESCQSAAGPENVHNF